ncbi:hypothetical protein A2U01_0108920, partial [Trifolium medium]|nr:hypothetical protein [Trifolium medium]
CTSTRKKYRQTTPATPEMGEKPLSPQRKVNTFRYSPNDKSRSVRKARKRYRWTTPNLSCRRQVRT